MNDITYYIKQAIDILEYEEPGGDDVGMAKSLLFYFEQQYQGKASLVADIIDRHETSFVNIQVERDIEEAREIAIMCEEDFDDVDTYRHNQWDFVTDELWIVRDRLIALTTNDEGHEMKILCGSNTPIMIGQTR